MTISGDITDALAARLATIKQTAGYALDITQVFHPLNSGEFQPMGMDLQDHQMPAIILYQGPVKVDPQHHLNTMHGLYYLELIRPWVPDKQMWDMVAAVGKAVWGGSVSATENTNFRFHPNVVEPQMQDIVPDFGMLQGHRIWVVVLAVSYRVRYTNL